jgi:hypothetical protein
MLAGQFGYFYNGTVRRSDYLSCPNPRGWIWIHEVVHTGCGISVVDLRERRGLKSQGGWILEGGLLGRVYVGENRVELYGKRIVRHEPFLEPWPHVWIGNRSWNASHEFFLVHRESAREHAVILRSWILADPETRGGYRFVPRGSLESREPSQSVRVRVMHAHDADLVLVYRYVEGFR